MYERVPVDNANSHRPPPVPAELTLDDGRILKGKFHVSGTKRFFDVLNGSGLFLDFEQHDGERELIAKSIIRAVKLVTVPRARGLPAPAANPNDAFQPHKILGLNTSADVDEIRHAYHCLSKMYHPDRHAASNLPTEVLDYLNNSSRRINAAFDALKQQHQTAATTQPQHPAPIRAQPVYTSSSRSENSPKLTPTPAAHFQRPQT